MISERTSSGRKGRGGIFWDMKAKKERFRKSWSTFRAEKVGSRGRL